MRGWRTDLINTEPKSEKEKWRCGLEVNNVRLHSHKPLDAWRMVPGCLVPSSLLLARGHGSGSNGWLSFTCNINTSTLVLSAEWTRASPPPVDSLTRLVASITKWWTVRVSRSNGCAIPWRPECLANPWRNCRYETRPIASTANTGNTSRYSLTVAVRQITRTPHHNTLTRLLGSQIRLTQTWANMNKLPN